MFRPLLGHLLTKICKHLVSHNALRHRHFLDFFLRGSEGDLIKAGFEPANLGIKGQHATPRPPKPIILYIHCKNLQ